MALYVYQALTKSGKKVTGKMDAASEALLRADLVAKNMYPVSIDLYKESSVFQSFFGNLFQGSVSFKDLIFFTKQLSVLLRSGVPLLQALELLSEQFTGKFHSILVSLKDGIKEGKSLADGLENYPELFSTIYVQLVKAGEASGKLESILDRLIDYLERREALRKKVKGALSYPLFQLGIIVLIVVGLMVEIVPNLVKVIQDMTGDIPTQTKILMTMSDFLINHYVMLWGIIFSIVAVFSYWKSTERGQYTIDYLMLKLPMIKFFSRTNAVVQFCSTLGMLLESGVHLSQSLDIVCNIIENKILLESLKEAKEKIVKQGKITPFLKETGVFPSMAIYLINTGEQSGQLDSMLLVVAKNYEEELSELTDSLTSKLEPIMILVMGVIVGLVMWAIMGPIMSMYGSESI